MRSPELLSESSLLTCFRLMAFAFVAAGIASPSESLELNEGPFLGAVLDEGLVLDRASKIDGCFTSKRNEQEKQAVMKTDEGRLLVIIFN